MKKYQFYCMKKLEPQLIIYIFHLFEIYLETWGYKNRKLICIFIVAWIETFKKLSNWELPKFHFFLGRGGQVFRARWKLNVESWERSLVQYFFSKSHSSFATLQADDGSVHFPKRKFIRGENILSWCVCTVYVDLII